MASGAAALEVLRTELSEKALPGNTLCSVVEREAGGASTAFFTLNTRFLYGATGAAQVSNLTWASSVQTYKGPVTCVLRCVTTTPGPVSLHPHTSDPFPMFFLPHPPL